MNLREEPQEGTWLCRHMRNMTDLKYVCLSLLHFVWILIQEYKFTGCDICDTNVCFSLKSELCFAYIFGAHLLKHKKMFIWFQEWKSFHPGFLSYKTCLWRSHTEVKPSSLGSYWNRSFFPKVKANTITQIITKKVSLAGGKINVPKKKCP